MNDSLLEEIKTDELLHIYKTNSPEINNELHNKFHQFPSITDFFKHYTNINIKLFNENINIFFSQIYTIADINSLNTFKSSVDQYITDFSQLYIVLNAICKINESIEKIVTKIKLSLPLLYERHCLDKDYQNKINEIATYMLNTNINRGNYSSTSTLENSENSEEFQSKSNKLLNIEKIDLLKDLLEKDLNNKSKPLETPRFEENLTSIKEKSKENEEARTNSKKSIKRNNSTDSNFSFMNSNQKLINEKSNKKDNNIENENNNIISANINDYITSVPKNSFMTKFNHLKKRNRFVSSKELNGANYKSDISKNFNLNVPMNEHSEKIIVNEDSKMYADLLDIIFELYKNKKISYEQKVKLKKLIIRKCPKILNVYKSFQNVDNEKLIEGLKELV
jgi:hypothetical protein